MVLRLHRADECGSGRRNTCDLVERLRYQWSRLHYLFIDLAALEAALSTRHGTTAAAAFSAAILAAAEPPFTTPRPPPAPYTAPSLARTAYQHNASSTTPERHHEQSAR